MIHLEEVSPDNRRLDLHVRNDQKDFAANSITLLARAYAYRNSGSRALIIYNEDIPIGMALYYYIDGAYDFSQFFIDERYQGNGFGYEAAGHVLREMQKTGFITELSFAILKETKRQNNCTLNSALTIREKLTATKSLWRKNCGSFAV